VGVALVVAAGLGGGYWWSHEQSARGSHDGHTAVKETGSGSPKTLRVEVIYPKKGGMQRTSTQVGSVHPVEWADLFAKISGFLKEQSVDFGSQVKKDQVLAVIDDPEVVKERDRAAAALEQAKVAVDVAGKKIAVSEKQREAAAADVKQAQAEVARYTSTRKYREKVLARYEGLYQRNAVDLAIVQEEEEHLESARANEQASQAAVLTAQARFLAAEAAVEQAKSDYEAAKANVEVAAATLAKAQVLVDYTKIIAPYDGVITHRSFFRGAFIRSAAEGETRSLLTLARTDKVRVVTFIPDRDVPYVDVGDDAEIRLDALPGEVFKGKVSRFSETEDPQSRTMHTEIDLPNPDGRLREGMYGIATVILEKNLKNLTIPVLAVVDRSDGDSSKAFVYVVRDGKAHKVPITIGAEDGIRVEIVEGLKADDMVVLNGRSVSEELAVIPELVEDTAKQAEAPKASH
jgi:RND family efflux transporter MFP subunit